MLFRSACDKRLSELPIKDVNWKVWHDDVFNVIAAMPEESLDFVWIDDNHEKEHVDREITALLPKMRVKGLITGHDVWGSCDLQEIFTKHGGYAIRTPMLGLAGGIGIIQVR